MGDFEVRAFKFAAVEGAIGDWALYYGPIDWTDERVKAEGNKVSEPIAVALSAQGFISSKWRMLAYRA